MVTFITKNDLHKYPESFPLWVDSYNDSGFIVKSNAFDTIEIKQGDINTEVNGVPQSVIKKEIAKYSGESEIFALRHAVGFLFPLWVELLDIRAPFTIEYQRNNMYKTINTNGVSAILYNNVYGHLFSNRTQSFRFSIIENNIAYIEFNTFDFPKEFSKFLKKSFKTIKKNKCAGLIIDMRNNEGGKEDIGPMFIDYIYDKPYKVTYSANRKVSEYHKNLKKAVAQMEEYKYLKIDTISAYFQAPNGTIIVEIDTSLIYPTNNKFRFNGKTCVLIGPKCFSWANNFAAVIKYNKIVYLIGEPLEELQEGYADVSHIILPETKFKFRTSTAYFYPIDKDNTEPVQPDIFVNQSIEDTKKGADTALEYAKKWIMKQ